jgi:hypothetical protein
LRGRLCGSWRRQSARRERHSQRSKSANIDHRNPSTRRVARQRLSDWTCEGSSTCPSPSLRRVLPSRQGKNEALVVEGNRQKVPVSDLSQPTLTIVLRVLRPARALQHGEARGAARRREADPSALEPAGRVGTCAQVIRGPRQRFRPAPRISRVRVRAQSAAAMAPAGERSRGADFRSPPPHAAQERLHADGGRHLGARAHGRREVMSPADPS